MADTRRGSKRAATKKAASSKQAAADKQQGVDPSASGSEDDRNAGQPGFTGDSGPRHDLPDPPDDNGPEYPTTQISGDADSGPIVPQDAHTQVKPQHGYSDSSTDDVYGAVGGRTIAGENHLGFEDGDGGDVGDLDSAFEDDGQTMLKVKKTVVEKFSYANSPDHEERRLLLNEGQRVSRRQADMLKESAKREQEPTFASQG